jgi:hypothetical protein
MDTERLIILAFKLADGNWRAGRVNLIRVPRIESSFLSRRYLTSLVSLDCEDYTRPQI